MEWQSCATITRTKPKKLWAGAQAIAEDGIETARAVHRWPPRVEISAVADKDKVDLLVLGSHGHSALGGMLLGSVTNEVLVRTKRATLIVRGKAKKYPDSLRIGVAVDGSAYGPAAVKYVLRHAELFGAAPCISLIHVVQTYDLVGIPSVAGFAPPAFTPAEVRSMQNKAYGRPCGRCVTF